MRRRLFVPTLVAKAEREGELFVVRSPGVGLWRDAPQNGERLLPKASLGELEVLGAMHRLEVPDGATGLVVRESGGLDLARRPVEFGEVLLRLDPRSAGETAIAETSAAEGAEAAGLVFRSPSGGRYYQRPGPGKDPFVKVGDIVTRGQTVALLEVMKTFNRVQYGAEGLPERVRVLRIVPADQDDLQSGDVVLELEAVP